MDNLRKRLLFHCTHMGMMENDVLFGTFIKANLKALSDQDVKDLESLLSNNDMDLFMWASQKIATPKAWDTPVLRRLIAFNGASKT